jgi:hypothetical protein
MAPGCGSLSVPILGVKPAVRWRVGVVGGSSCVRADAQPYLSVLVPGWLQSGDMMGDGVFRDAVRPLGL